MPEIIKRSEYELVGYLRGLHGGGFGSPSCIHNDLNYNISLIKSLIIELKIIYDVATSVW